MSIVDKLSKAKETGVFDPGWYSQTYGLGFENDADAFADYLRKSKHSWVNPSQGFSTKKYFQVHSAELQCTDWSPLEHFLHSEDNGTYLPDLTEAWHPETWIHSSCTYQGSFSCAITAHIFYDDYLLRLADCLKGFPLGIDVLLAVSSEDTKLKAQDIFLQIDCVSNLVVRVVPNRGRNFGPLLVEFGKILLNYDIFCHVHSKKSLFSGSSQEAWGNYLFEYLLQDKRILMKMLAIFEEHENLGLYYPTAFSRSLPKWASHTLKNRSSMSEVATLLSIGPIQDGFISYPVGGMFWAKTKALRNLLSKDWTYNDFPEEPIQNDGTNLHAIERLLTPIAESNGYKEFVYSPETGSYTTDRGHITKDYLHTRGDLGYIINSKSIQILSFDIFDTLCRRGKSYPDHAKEVLAETIGYPSIEDFVRMRNNAEHELRIESGFVGDISILAVYERLKDYLDTEYSAEELAELEFNADLKCLLPKRILIDALNSALSLGKIIYICSDTYYTKNQIRRLLDAMNVAQEAVLFVSSDMGLRKDNGTMWQHIKNNLLDSGIDPLSEFMHIGDNVVSDAQVAGDHGLGNYHILNPFEKWNCLSTIKMREQDMKDPAIREIYGPLISVLGADPFL